MLERFNLQSGLSRGSYKDMAVGPSCAHDGAILGLACDSTNVLLTSGGYDGFLKVSSFTFTLLYYSDFARSLGAFRDSLWQL